MRVLVIAMLLLLGGCDLVLPQAHVVAPLRDADGLVARCTGEPLPTFDDCRSHGEQAYIELAGSEAAARAITVVFGPVRPTGCRDVTWTVAFVAGPETTQGTEVCD